MCATLTASTNISISIGYSMRTRIMVNIIIDSDDNSRNINRGIQRIFRILYVKSYPY